MNSMNTHSRKELLIATYIITIFCALHLAIPYFVLSAFLATYFKTIYISTIFVITGIVTIFMGNYFSLILKKYTNYRTLLTVCFIQILITIILPFIGNIHVFLLIIIFIAHVVLTSLIWSCINIFLDEFSPTEETGAIRGLSSTIYHLGVMIAPFLTAKLLNHYAYSGVFLLSSLMVVPIIFFTHKYLRHVQEPDYKHKSLIKAIKQIRTNPDLHGVFISYFSICSFYSVMNIYFVLYLLNEIKIPMSTYLGIVTPIFLLPFILLPFKLGKLSDQIFGEKKLMIFGMLIVAFIVLSIYFFNINTSSIFIWSIILFISRIGASINETENHTYFYKKINSENSDLIYIFENMKYISLIFVSALGLIFIDVFKLPIPTLLLVIGTLGLCAIYKIQKIHDIKPKKIIDESLIITNEASNVSDNN